KRGDALLPRRRAGRLGRGGPVILGPRALLVGRVAAEVENVELGDPEMLEELPGREREPGRSGTLMRGTHSRDGGVEADVALFPAEELLQLGAKRLVLPVLHGIPLRQTRAMD